MTVAQVRYHWTQEEFLRAWEAGAFAKRAELVDGEVWQVPIGDWHGEVTGLVFRALPNREHVVTGSSLPTVESVPDPDCWVRPRSAEPATKVSTRLSAWRPSDVVLVVEVGDETEEQDLGQKAQLYARGGFAVYWVVTRDGVFEHTDPTAEGYRSRRLYRRDERVPVRYAGTDVAVDDLLPRG